MPPKKTNIADYKQQKNNHNKGSVFGDSLLEKSIQQNGLGRSILVSSDNVIIAGNHVQGKAGELGLHNVIEVETDGTQLVVVKRTDIKSDTAEFHRLSLTDNFVQKYNFIEDAEMVETILEEYSIDPLAVGYMGGKKDEGEAEAAGEGGGGDPDGYDPEQKALTVYFQSEAEKDKLILFFKQYGYKFD